MKRTMMMAMAVVLPVWGQTVPAAGEPAPHTPAGQRTAYVRRFSMGGKLSFPALGGLGGGDHERNLTAGPTLIQSTAEGRGVLVGGGLTMQIAVGDRYALTVDALRRKVGYYLTTTTYVGTDNTSTAADERTATGLKENTRASSWEMPMLLRRYNIGRFEEGPRWFWEAGVSIRRTGGVKTFIEEDNEECCLQTPAALAHRYTPGLTVGAGGQWVDDYGVKILPEFRYTYWTNRPFAAEPARSRGHQIEILIGVTF